jgi:hypothetical protein
MDYIKERTFEIFRYTLPGVFLISIILLLDNRISTPFDVYNLYFKEIPAVSAIGIIMFGFIIGFVIDYFTGISVNKLRKKTNKSNFENSAILNHSQKYALIREICPANFHHIENWNVYKGMCNNLAFGFLVLFGISICKTFASDDKLIWIIIIFISIISIISLLLNASKFNRWALGDIDAVIDMIEEISKKKNGI